MPVPRKDEPINKFMARCIPIVLDDKTANSGKQAFAICQTMWRQGQRSKDANKKDS